MSKSRFLIQAYTPLAVCPAQWKLFLELISVPALNLHFPSVCPHTVTTGMPQTRVLDHQFIYFVKFSTKVFHITLRNIRIVQYTTHKAVPMKTAETIHMTSSLMPLHKLLSFSLSIIRNKLLWTCYSVPRKLWTQTAYGLLPQLLKYIAFS